MATVFYVVATLMALACGGAALFMGEGFGKTVLALIGAFPVLLIYFGMGKVIERLDEIEGQNTEILDQIKAVTNLLGNVKSSDEGKWKCSNCGRENAHYVGTCGCGRKKEDN